MITFEQARELVKKTIPGGGDMEPYGYESPTRWFPVIAPEHIGGRVPGVSKADGTIEWMGASTPEYLTAVTVGQRP